jgi:hypothetical protein
MLRCMTHPRLPRERAPDAATARLRLPDCTLALWLVAVFLGALVATHYLLARVLAAGADVTSAIPVGLSPL